MGKKGTCKYGNKCTKFHENPNNSYRDIRENYEDDLRDTFTTKEPDLRTKITGKKFAYVINPEYCAMNMDVLEIMGEVERPVPEELLGPDNEVTVVPPYEKIDRDTWNVEEGHSYVTSRGTVNVRLTNTTNKSFAIQKGKIIAKIKY